MSSLFDRYDAEYRTLTSQIQSSLSTLTTYSGGGDAGSQVRKGSASFHERSPNVDNETNAPPLFEKEHHAISSFLDRDVNARVPLVSLPLPPCRRSPSVQGC